MRNNMALYILTAASALGVALVYITIVLPLFDAVTRAMAPLS